ncbi:LacI family DNA-binding transcriptional regulator [Roseburia hominis]
MPTINDIAVKLGISKGTVSKALNNADDVSETLRKKVLETAVEIGYKKNRVRKDSPNKLCIIVENMDYRNPMSFGYEIVLGFKKLAVPDGWTVETVDITPDSQKQQSYDTFMLEHKYQGAFILGFSLSDPWMEDLKTARTPAVLYDNYIQENPAVSYIGVNNEEGLDMAVSYLKELGHTRIGYLGGALESRITQARYNAYLQAMKNHELATSDEITGFSYHVSECIQQFLPCLLEEKVTAILCSHDSFASAVMQHLTELGYQVPEDVSVIGFDDAPFSAYTMPPLTTIRQDRSALGRCGYYALRSLLDHTAISTLLLRAELVKRESVCTASASLCSEL